MFLTKKRLLLVLLITFVSFSFIIAKTKLNPEKHSPLAIMTVFTNSTINWENEDPDVEIRSANSCVQFHPAIEKELNEVFTKTGFKLIDKKDIVSTKDYKNTAESNYYIGQDYVALDDYRLIPEKNRAAIIVKEKTDAKTFAYISIFLEKTMAEGYNKNGTMKCRVTVYVDITNENGRLITSSKYTELSEKSIQVVDGKYDPLMFATLFPKTIKAAITNAIAALG
jgi:hypothetical protein